MAFSDPLLNRDDTPWIEELRSRGATVYFGLTEHPANNPIKHLYEHVVGRYLFSHYVIDEMGAQYLVARLDKPIYGNFLFDLEPDALMAVPSSLLEKAKEHRQRVTELSEWFLADLILLDYHLSRPEEMISYPNVYRSALQDGFRVLYQHDGRILLKRNHPVEPVPDLTRMVITSTDQPEILTVEPGYVNLGILPAGDYLLSFDLPNQALTGNLNLQVMDVNNLVVLGQNSIDARQLTQLEQGERPEVHFRLVEAGGVLAYAESGGVHLQPQSVVCMPDVACPPVELTLQTNAASYPIPCGLMRQPREAKLCLLQQRTVPV